MFEGTVLAIHDDRAPLPPEAGGEATAIVTWVKLDVDTTWKGTIQSDSVYLRVPGGYADGRWQIWQGVPVLRSGDQVVVFGVSSGSGGLLNAVQLDQGILRLQLDGTQEIVRTGGDSVLADISASVPFQRHLPSAWSNSSSDGNCDATGSACDWGNTNSGITAVNTSPVDWSTARSAVAACVSAHSTPAQGPQTIDHSGVTP